MTAKRDKAAKPLTKVEAPKRNVLGVRLREGEDPEDAVVRQTMNPISQGAALIQMLQGDTYEINAVARELRAQVDGVNSGDMARPEAMLVAQSHSLDELYNNLARRATANLNAGYREAGEVYLRLAFKAQSQCRTTLEALTEMKTPRTATFVRQANIANGPQQVNNGMASPAHEKPIKNPSNELSEGTHELLSNTGAQTLEGRTDTPVEAVGAVNRAKDCGREGGERSQRNKTRKPVSPGNR